MASPARQATWAGTFCAPVRHCIFPLRSARWTHHAALRSDSFEHTMLAPGGRWRVSCRKPVLHYCHSPLPAYRACAASATARAYMLRRPLPPVPWWTVLVKSMLTGCFYLPLCAAALRCATHALPSCGALPHTACLLPHCAHWLHTAYCVAHPSHTCLCPLPACTHAYIHLRVQLPDRTRATLL